MKNSIFKLLFIFSSLLILTSCKAENIEFDGQSALQFAQNQMDFGPRVPGSQAHADTIDWIQTKLEEFGWESEIQTETLSVTKIQNIVAKRDPNNGPWVIIAAHYDSRFFSDQDSNANFQQIPVPGANDGASGVSVLLELARVLPKEIQKNVWLVFFDAEDQGRIENWDWILGSQSFVNQLSGKPNAVIILDMIGDKDLNIYYEKNSDKTLQEEIWSIAKDLGYEDSFIPEFKFAILDDHIPFVNKGIVAIDIIDFDYPYWHTSQDTMDKISGESLEKVGKTIYHWLLLP
ncbi:MAG: hypothetical protein CVU39_02515 [Chloroflexi bacterium HGW-Chloroflexi-10]|nr:MAG: hypothetical protein CVU39_02515 [Chloroflexi bacterium HGW-Chloroflexi-10]